MSYVSVRVVHEDGTVESGYDDSARNAHNFHVAIWQHLGQKHHGWPASYHCITDRTGKRLDELWAAIKTLPRADGIAMAATFDRCWFPWSMRDEVVKALRKAGSYAPTAHAVARILASPVDGEDRGRSHRGFTFSSSLASAWCCEGDDMGAHQIDAKGSRCVHCGKDDIEFAPDIIADPD